MTCKKGDWSFVNTFASCAYKDESVGCCAPSTVDDVVSDVVVEAAANPDEDIDGVGWRKDDDLGSSILRRDDDDADNNEIVVVVVGAVTKHVAARKVLVVATNKAAKADVMMNFMMVCILHNATSKLTC